VFRSSKSSDQPPYKTYARIFDHILGLSVPYFPDAYRPASLPGACWLLASCGRGCRPLCASSRPIMSLAGIGGYASSSSSDDDEAPAAAKRARSSGSDSGGDDESSSGNDSDSDAERRRRKRRAAASTAAAAATAGGLGPSVDDLFASTSSSFLASTVSRAPVIPLCTDHSALPKACALSCDDAAARRVGSLRGTDGGSGPRAGGRGGAGGAGGSGEGCPDAAGGGGGRGAGQEQRPNGQGGGGSQAGRCAFRTVVAGVCYGLCALAFCAWWCDGMLVGTSSLGDD
jgi:hypothetical protein